MTEPLEPSVNEEVVDNEPSLFADPGDEQPAVTTPVAEESEVVLERPVVGVNFAFVGVLPVDEDHSIGDAQADARTIVSHLKDCGAVFTTCEANLDASLAENSLL